jgi:hypothetical protein
MGVSFSMMVAGEDTDHGIPPWLESSPASDNLECIHKQ